MTKRPAFTLVEVLVVVAVIAILLAILAPTMGRFGVLAERTTCASNIHQLVTAWTEYAISNEMSLVEANTNSSSWVDSGGTLEAIQSGKLWQYTGSLGIYKCPTPVYDYATSYSISGNMNGERSRWKKHNVIPDASETMLMIEDDDWRDYNVNSWYIQRSGLYYWVDYVGFVDAHVEHWKWQDPDTLTLGYDDGPFGSPDPGSVDLERLAPVFKAATFYELDGTPKEGAP